MAQNEYQLWEEYERQKRVLAEPVTSGDISGLPKTSITKFFPTSVMLALYVSEQLRDLERASRLTITIKRVKSGGFSVFTVTDT
jgi:hypothetical protein